MKTLMNRIALFGLLFATSLTFVQETKAQANGVRMETASFSMMTPSGWTATKSDAMYLMSPSNQGNSEAFVVMEMDGDYDSAADAKIRSQIDEAMNELADNYQVLLDQNDDSDFRIIGFGFQDDGIEMRAVFSVIKIETKALLCAAKVPAIQVEARIAELVPAIESIELRTDATQTTKTTKGSAAASSNEIRSNDIREVAKASLRKVRKANENSSALSGTYVCISEKSIMGHIYYVFNDTQSTQVFDMYQIQQDSETDHGLTASETDELFAIGLTDYSIQGSEIVSEGSSVPFEITKNSEGKRIVKMRLNQGGEFSYWKEIDLN